MFLKAFNFLQNVKMCSFPSTQILEYQILKRGPQIYMQDNHLLMLCGQLATPLLPSPLLSSPLILCFPRISAAKRS